MATDTDYRKYTWRNLGQKELKEMWFAARGSYSTSNQTVSLSALGNYFGTGDFKDSILKHEGPEYLVVLRYHGNGTTSENPLPLTYKIDTNDERQNSNVAASITADNVIEISMATGLKVDAYRIKGESFLKNCWRNQEIADSIEQPFVDKTETVHQTEMELDLPTNMTYVKLPRYGFTNEAIEKVGVDGLFDSAKEKRAKEDAIGLVKSSATDGTKIYEPGFKWGASLLIKGQSYDTSLLKQWGFAERAPIVLADTYTKECRFHLPEIKTLADKDILQVKCNNGTVKTFNFVEGDILACYIQKADIADASVQYLTKIPRDKLDDTMDTGLSMYTWYEKGYNHSLEHTVTDLLVQPKITVQLSDMEAHGAVLQRNMVYQTANIKEVECAIAKGLEAPFLAPLSKTLSYTINPTYQDFKDDVIAMKAIRKDLPQGGSVVLEADVPAQMTFSTDNKVSGAIALDDTTNPISRYTINSTLVQSLKVPMEYAPRLGVILRDYLTSAGIPLQPYFDWKNEQMCGGDHSLSGFVLVSSLPAQVTFNNIRTAWNITKENLFSDIYTSQLRAEGPKINTFDIITKELEGETVDTYPTGDTFHNVPIMLLYNMTHVFPAAYVWNWNFEVTNFPIEARHSITLNSIAGITNQSFSDLTASGQPTRPIATSVFERVSELPKDFSTYLDVAESVTTSVRLSDENWGSSVSTKADATQCPDHVVFILWSKSSDAYEYLKKQLLKSP